MKTIFTLFFFSFSNLVFSQNYFPKPSGDLTNLSTWGIDSLGTGTPPATFLIGSFNVNRADTILKPWVVKDVFFDLPEDDDTIVLSAAVSVRGVLSFTKGFVNNKSMLSVSLDSGYIKQWVGGNLIGKLKVTKAIKNAGWHNIGICLDSVPLKSVLSLNKIDSVYIYDETDMAPNAQSGWKLLSDSSALLQKGRGYACKFSKPDTLSIIGYYDKKKSGIVYNTTFTSSGADLLQDGWHLVSNPMGSSLNWDLVGKTEIDEAIYYYDNSQHKNISYVGGLSNSGASNVISSLQGFWIHTSGNRNGTLTMDAGDISYENKSFLRTSVEEPNFIRLKLTSPFSGSDEAVVNFNSLASDGFDSNLDAYKLMNSRDTVFPPVFYTLSKNIKYSINSLPDFTDETVRIPLGIFGPSGVYTFSIQNELEEDMKFFLYDKVKDSLSAIISSISISHDFNDTDNKYELILDRDGMLTSTREFINSPYELNVIGNDVTLKRVARANLAVYNGTGQLISQKINCSDLEQLFLPNGFYIINIIDAQGSKSIKTIINN